MLNNLNQTLLNANSEELLMTAEAVANYIKIKRIKDEKGIRWSIKDAFEGKHFCNDEISLYSGSAGIGNFLLNLYELTNKTEYLDDAVGAADYIIWRWDNSRGLDKNFSTYAYTTGYAGIAIYLMRIHETTNNKKYHVCVEDIIKECIANAKTPDDGIGKYWSDFPGIVGNASTILFLLYAAEKYKRNEWKEFAIDAGKYYLNKGHEYKNGIYYEGVNPAYFGAGNDLIDPNFPMGTAGIGFLLLKLYEASGDEKFLKAEERILTFEKNIATKQRKGILLPHALPYRPNLFYLGYCHGPVGTIRYFYQGYKVRHNDEYKQIATDLFEGLISAGVPECRTEGFWQVHNVCCGTAGLMVLFSGLYADEEMQIADKETLYNLMLRTGKVLVDSATVSLNENKEKIVYWEQALDRVTPNLISNSIGYYEGAAGIGDSLLILYRFMNNNNTLKRAIDDPFQ